MNGSTCEAVLTAKPRVQQFKKTALIFSCEKKKYIYINKKNSYLNSPEDFFPGDTAKGFLGFCSVPWGVSANNFVKILLVIKKF